MSSKKSLEIIIMALCVMLFAFFMRLVDHPANFAPLGAMSLFMGYYLGGRWKFVLPLAVLFISDLFLGFYGLGVMVSVYGSFLLISILGHIVRNKKQEIVKSKVLTLFLSSLTGSVLFFLVTNAAVWYFTPMYANTWNGLLASYTMAIPFFRNTLFSDIFYVGVLFGTMEVVLYYSAVVKRILFLVKITTEKGCFSGK